MLQSLPHFCEKLFVLLGTLFMVCERSLRMPDAHYLNGILLLISNIFVSYAVCQQTQVMYILMYIVQQSSTYLFKDFLLNYKIQFQLNKTVNQIIKMQTPYGLISSAIGACRYIVRSHSKYKILNIKYLLKWLNLGILTYN